MNCRVERTVSTQHEAQKCTSETIPHGHAIPLPTRDARARCPGRLPAERGHVRPLLMLTRPLLMLNALLIPAAVALIQPGKHKQCDTTLLFHQMLVGRDIAKSSPYDGPVERRVYEFGRACAP